MNLLAIDTSTHCASVALITKGDLRSAEQASQQSHARLLLPMIERLLKDASLNLSQLDGIIFGRGPGSFTGIRIACSVAKGLAYATDLPLYPVSTLAAIANNLFEIYPPPAESKVLALLDARMNQVYWSCFNQNGEQSEERVSAIADICLSSVEAPLILAGVNYESYLSELRPELKKRILAHYEIYPQASAMIHLVMTGTIKPVSAEEALPVYIRNQITQGESRG